MLDKWARTASCEEASVPSWNTCIDFVVSLFTVQGRKIPPQADFKPTQHIHEQKLLSFSFYMLMAPTIYLPFHSAFPLLYPHSAGKCPFYVFYWIFLSTYKMHTCGNKSKSGLQRKRQQFLPLCSIPSKSFQQGSKAKFDVWVSTLVPMFIQPYVNIHTVLIKFFPTF